MNSQAELKGTSHSWLRMMVQNPSRINNKDIISNINIEIIKRKGLETNTKYTRT